MHMRLTVLYLHCLVQLSVSNIEKRHRYKIVIIIPSHKKIARGNWKSLGHTLRKPAENVTRLGGGGGGVYRGFVPDIQVCGSHGRDDIANATITSKVEEGVTRKAMVCKPTRKEKSRSTEEDHGGRRPSSDDNLHSPTVI